MTTILAVIGVLAIAIALFGFGYVAGAALSIKALIEKAKENGITEQELRRLLELLGSKA